MPIKPLDIDTTLWQSTPPDGTSAFVVNSRTWSRLEFATKVVVFFMDASSSRDASRQSRIQSVFEFQGRGVLRRFADMDASAIPSAVWIIGAWALFAFPTVLLRSAHYEEGTIIALARGALEDDHWLAPFRYGVRFIERPVLLSWIIAGLAKLTGSVTLLTARLPHLMFLLAGAFLVFDLIKTQASKSAGLFGALCWFTCPMVAQKFVTAEPDVTVSVLLFAAFWLWWKGHVCGSLTIKRCLGVGLVLGLAGLTKGPQPMAYFIIGVGLYLVIKRRWHEIPLFLLTNLIAALVVSAWYVYVFTPGDASGWLEHSRLVQGLSGTALLFDHIDFAISLCFEWLPCSILLVPIIRMLVRGFSHKENELLLACILYALGCSLVLLLWPGGVATRYAMPANLALAVAAGLMFARWRDHHPRLMAGSLLAAYGVAAYMIVVGWLVMPSVPALFQRSRIAGEITNTTNANIAGPLVLRGADQDYNALAHVTRRIAIMSKEGG